MWPGWETFGHYLVWPLVALIAMLVFKDPIRLLLERITKASILGGGIEASPQHQTSAPIAAPTVASATTATTSGVPQIQPASPGNPQGPNVIPAVGQQGGLVWPSDSLPQGQQLDAVRGERNSWLVSAAFYRTFAAMFRSQYNALNALLGRDLRYSELRPFYSDGKNRGLTASFEDWLDFLVTNAMITRREDAGNPDVIVSITPMGRAFVAFCMQQMLVPANLPF